MNENVSASVKKVLVLKVVERTDFASCVFELNHNFRSTDLQDMVDSLRCWLSDKKVVHIAADGSQTSCVPVASYFALKSHRKNDAMNFLASFLANEDNCRQMIAGFPVIVQETIKACLDHFYIDVEPLTEKEGIQRILTKETDRWRSGYSLVSPWFVLRGDYCEETKMYSLSLPVMLYPYFYRAFYPKMETAGCQLPTKDESLNVLHTEESAVRVFQIVRNQYESGELDINNKGKMKAAALKKCVQQLGVFEEFFPNTKESTLKNLRASLFYSYLYYRLNRVVLRSTRKELSMEEVLHDDNYETLLPFPRLTMSLLLPHLTGIPNSADTSNCYALVTDLLPLLRNHALAEGKWLYMKEIYSYILSKNQGFEHLKLFLATDSYYDRVMLKNGKTTKKEVPFSRFRKEISEPYVKALFLMMASAGLFDVAYRDYQTEDTSWVDSLEYVRITNLGKYVWGFSKKYEPCFKAEKIEYFDVDPDRLIVRSLVEHNPYEGYLNDVANAIGNRRYVFTEESFIRKCHSKQEVEAKMEFFVKFVAPTLSPIWRDFFDSVLKNCQPFLPLRSMEYTLYQLNPTNKALIHLLNTDSQLKKLVIRAEGFIFLVHECDRKTFSDRLRTLGYLM